MDIPLLYEFVVIFCLSIVVIYACHKINIPPILGFLITGVLCGPYGLGLVQAVNQVEMVAEIGVVLLMFSIGMEMSLSELIRLRKPVFVGGTLQVVLTVILFALLGHIMVERWGTDVFAGFVISLSSTAIVLSVLQSKAQMDSPHGKGMLGILLFQDLAVVPMMLAIPILAGRSAGNFSWLELGHAVGTLAAIGVGFMLARKVVPWLMRKVAATRIRELFLMTTLGICFAIAYLTSLLGLSLSLGAFLAGMILTESEYSFSAMEGVMPFKDVFTSLFFISVGMLLDTSFFIENLGTVLSLTAAVIIVKTLCATGTGLLLGYPLRTAILIGMGLAQVGEFSFVLAKSGLDYQLFSADVYQLFLAAIIVTMAATPFIMGASPVVARFMSECFRRSSTGEGAGGGEGEEISGHLIIIGFGLGGQHLARAAKLSQIPYVILEMNPQTVRLYKKSEPIRYGDASHPSVLTSLGVMRAKVLAIVISDREAASGVTQMAKRMNPGLHVIVRTPYWSDIESLHRKGADEVVCEEYETSIALFHDMLRAYKVPFDVIEHFTREIRSEAPSAKEKSGGKAEQEAISS